jgi:hypothetical protein
MDWLHRVTSSLAERAGIDASALTLTAQDRAEILDLARIASHTSGDRTNAPLLCYVLGLLTGAGVGLAKSGPVVREVTEP